jgi:AcrR family transcriptional regulator
LLERLLNDIEQPFNPSRGTPDMTETATGAGARDRILAATVAVLCEGGLMAAQTRAVTTRAGVGTGLLNHYFRWPDLRASAWQTIFAQVAADMRRPGETPVDALDRFLTESFADAARPLWRLWIEAEGLAVRDPAMAQAVGAARAALRDGLTAILSDGVAHGAWHLDAPRATALRLEALRDGLVALLLAGDPELDRGSAEACLRDSFWRET